MEKSNSKKSRASLRKGFSIYVKLIRPKNYKNKKTCKISELFKNKTLEHTGKKRPWIKP